MVRNMSEIFKAKVREVGTSLGVLIPKEVAKEMKIKKGQEIEISVLKKNPEMIAKFFGIDKGAKPFERDHRDREF
jgi:antitoxin component of MazEF toxin-antitoxin module